MPSASTYTNDSLFVIPDEGMTSSEIEVGDSGTFSALRVTVNVTHDFPLDLRFTLIKDGNEVTFAEELAEESAFIRTFTVEGFEGVDRAGTWTLRVEDLAGGDEGTLNSWSLELTD